MKKLLIIIKIFLAWSIGLQGQTPNDFSAAGLKAYVHDPVMIKENGIYYLFSTGPGISVMSSRDLTSWKKEKPVFATPPRWAIDAVNGYNGHTWAPDISYHNGSYYLYYSVSTFGKNNSCIGLAVNKTLDPNSPNFKWEDQGMIIQSKTNRDDFNAIDPNLVLDDKGQPWLSWGSFWGGIKMVGLKADFRTKNSQIQTIATRRGNISGKDSVFFAGAIEAPFVFKRNGFYYLFVSWDYCCRGVNSNYKVVVGRSENVNGPYLDKDGVNLARNGGTVLAKGDAFSWAGVGHNGIFTDDDQNDYLLMHGYDISDNGRSKLIIRRITWSADHWPAIIL